MTTDTISAFNNPDAINEAVAQATAEPSKETRDILTLNPPDTLVDLPGGYMSLTGEVYTTAEVRELTGKDEEAIARTTSLARAMNTVLLKGTVSVGDEPATEKVLDNMLSGDRDTLLLGIYKATFGPTAELPTFCDGCREIKTVAIEIDTDIKVKKLEDPIGDRNFTVETRKGEVDVTLPTGVTQRELLSSTDKSSAELASILLQNTVTSINGTPVYNKNQVLNLGIADRRKIGDEIAKRNPGPQLQDVTVECPDCGGDVTVPVNFGTLFRF